MPRKKFNRFPVVPPTETNAGVLRELELHVCEQLGVEARTVSSIEFTPAQVIVIQVSPGSDGREAEYTRTELSLW